MSEAKSLKVTSLPKDVNQKAWDFARQLHLLCLDYDDECLTPPESTFHDKIKVFLVEVLQEQKVIAEAELAEKSENYAKLVAACKIQADKMLGEMQGEITLLEGQVAEAQKILSYLAQSIVEGFREAERFHYSDAISTYAGMLKKLGFKVTIDSFGDLELTEENEKDELERLRTALPQKEQKTDNRGVKSK